MTGKTYTGYRKPGEGGTADEPTVTVHEGGHDPRPLDPRLDLRRHSVAGFNWGYGGSGPGQLALALAADALGDDDRAARVYRDLKLKVVARLPADGWSLAEGQLLAAIAAIKQTRRRGRG